MDIGGLVKTFFNNAGPGGVMVMLIFGVACTIYFVLIRWILAGSHDEETAVPDEQPVSVDA